MRVIRDMNNRADVRPIVSENEFVKHSFGVPTGGE